MTESKISSFRDFPIQQVVIEVRVSEILKSKSSVRFDFYGWVEDTSLNLLNGFILHLARSYYINIYWLIYQTLVSIFISEIQEKNAKFA